MKTQDKKQIAFKKQMYIKYLKCRDRENKNDDMVYCWYRLNKITKHLNRLYYELSNLGVGQSFFNI